MNVDEVTDAFQALGFEEDAAQVFVTLSLLRDAKAAEIATQAEIPRPRAYRILDRLVDQGFVYASMTRPVQYRAVPVDDVFDHLLEKKETERQAILDTRHRIGSLLERIRLQPTTDLPDRSFRILHGRSAIMDVAKQLLGSASDDIRILMTAPSSLCDALQEPSVLARLSEHRDTIRIQGQLAEDLPCFRELAQALGGDIRPAGPAARLRFILMDGRSLLTHMSSRSTPGSRRDEETVMWTNTPGILAHHAHLFETVWGGPDAVVEEIDASK